MKAAVLHELGEPASMTSRRPSPSDGLVVEVDAVALGHFDLLKVSGAFYTGPPELPSIVGSDGVGRLTDGRRVYFDTTVTPFGSLAQKCVVSLPRRSHQCPGSRQPPRGGRVSRARSSPQRRRSLDLRRRACRQQRARQRVACVVLLDQA